MHNTLKNRIASVETINKGPIDCETTIELAFERKGEKLQRAD
jgi:hypothetical protein